MSEKTIRETHERLEEMKHTHSTKIVNEVKSDAHKDRGELLGIIDELKEVNGMALKTAIDLTEQLDKTMEYWKDEIKKNEGLVEQLADEKQRAADLDAFIQGEEATANGEDRPD